MTILLQALVPLTCALAAPGACGLMAYLMRNSGPGRGTD